MEDRSAAGGDPSAIERAGQAIEGAVSGFARNLSMSSWLALVVLAVTITSLVVTSVVSLTYGSNLADGLLEGQLRSQLILKSSEIDSYLDSLAARTGVLAQSRMTVEAAERFSEAYEELDVSPEDPADEEIVGEFYRDDFLPTLTETTGLTVPWRELMPVGSAGLYLQRHYVVAGDGEEGVPRRAIDDAGDGSTWSEVHSEFHPDFVEIADRNGVQELYIIEPETGAVVYSISKGIEFGTSLELGPHSGTALAALVRTVRGEGPDGAGSTADLAPYLPDLGHPTGFIASPVADGGELVGILVVKLPLEQIDAIMTSGGNWESVGLGETGETFLVGADGRMRSTSRLFIENQAGYLETVGAAGTATSQERAAMASAGTTALFQDVTDAEVLEAASTENDELIEITNYLGRETFATYLPLQTELFGWYAAAEVEQAEVNQPVDRFRQAVVIAVSLFVVVIAFLTVAWAREVFHSVRAISEQLRRAHEGEELRALELSDRSPVEFTELAESIDEMISLAHQRQADLASAAAERVDTVRSLLPAAIAERIEAGDRLVLDQIMQASVVVVVVDGIGGLLQHGSPDERRDALDRVVEELDAIARRHGVERVKLLGDAYYAGCGLNHPYLDHAPRAVAFALDVREALRELSESLPVPLAGSAGVHSGPVSVGLAGSSRLVYDIWGESVGRAYGLARSARRNEVLVTDQARRLLPTGIPAEVREGEGDSAVWRVEIQDATEQVPS